MGKLKTKQFQLLTDINMAWDFMVEVCDAIDNKNIDNSIKYNATNQPL